jgi:hypothetical protein
MVGWLATDNRWAYYLGLGAFHTGVEVCGSEWTFGFHSYDTTGVFSSEPRAAPGAVFRESLLIGYSKLSAAQIDAVIEALARRYPGNAYHMLTRNCVTFCDELCFALTGRRAPGWTNRLPTLASYLQCVLPPSLRGPYPQDGEETPILTPPTS